MKCSIFGETTIDITVDSGYSYRYVTPSFCDGLTAPVIAYDRQVAANIASTMTDLAAYTLDHMPGSLPSSSGFQKNHQFGGGI